MEGTDSEEIFGQLESLKNDLILQNPAKGDGLRYNLREKTMVFSQFLVDAIEKVDSVLKVFGEDFKKTPGRS